MITKEFVQNFEQEIAELGNKGLIKAPYHLDGSIDNSLEDKLFSYFKDNNINKNTWIFSTHRSHYPWLLSGRNPEELKKQILDGNSMSVFGYKFFTSSIVAGNVSIALGVAQALKFKNSKEKVHCFIGDSAFYCGITKECISYAQGHDLPIIFVVLNNKFSVRANTKEVWGKKNIKNKLKIFIYDKKFPHAGSGSYVMF